MEIWWGSVLFDPYELPIKTEQAFICCGTELQSMITSTILFVLTVSCEQRQSSNSATQVVRHLFWMSHNFRIRLFRMCAVPYYEGTNAQTFFPGAEVVAAYPMTNNDAKKYICVLRFKFTRQSQSGQLFQYFCLLHLWLYLSIFKAAYKNGKMCYSGSNTWEESTASAQVFLSPNKSGQLNFYRGTSITITCNARLLIATFSVSLASQNYAVLCITLYYTNKN